MVVGGEGGGDDEHMDADVEDFGVVRECGETDAEGEEDEAAEEEAEAAEEAEDRPDAADEEEESEGFGVEVAEVLGEDAVVEGEFGDGGHFLLVVLHVEGGIGAGAVAEFVDTCEEETETDPEAEEEVSEGEVPAAGGGARGVRHGRLKGG